MKWVFGLHTFVIISGYDVLFYVSICLGYSTSYLNNTNLGVDVNHTYLVDMINVYNQLTLSKGNVPTIM